MYKSVHRYGDNINIYRIKPCKEASCRRLGCRHRGRASGVWLSPDTRADCDGSCARDVMLEACEWPARRRELAIRAAPDVGHLMRANKPAAASGLAALKKWQ